jgi:hypothetical protein
MHFTFTFIIYSSIPTYVSALYKSETYEVCPESNENEIPTLPTAVGWEGQV